MGFHNFAGSAVIHFVGGLTALIGAKILGPRVGKFNKDGSPNGIPGHSLTIGALGVFILWFGWYGFNGAAAKNGTQAPLEMKVPESVMSGKSPMKISCSFTSPVLLFNRRAVT